LYDTKLKSYFDLVVPQQLAENEYIRIMLINKYFKKNEFVKTYDEVVSIIEKHKHSNNIFIGSATNNGNDNGQADNLSRRQVIFLDFDKKDYPQYKDAKAFTAHIKKKLPQLYNHCMIDSGNGYHFYVAIEPTNDIERLVNINKDLAMILGADPNAVKITQVFRVPKTFNLKSDARKPVSVIYNTYGSDKFKRYTLNSLENMVKFSLKNEAIKKELPKIEYLHNTHYHCIEKMIHEGADKGERNFCLGRIVKYLKDIKGLSKHNALQSIKEWNARCRPVKDVNDIASDFENYWNGDYRLLGCVLPEGNNQAILSKYCDRYSCKTIINGETKGKVDGKELKMDNHLLTNKTMRKLSGNHYLVLTVLHIHEQGLSLSQLKEAITSSKTGKPCLDDRTLRKVLSNLVEWGYINDKFYKLLDIKNYGMGYTRYYYSVTLLLINKIITPQEYLVYLTLVRNLQQRKDVSYGTLSDDLDIPKQNIHRAINSLNDKKVLFIEKVYTDKGLLSNRYVLVA